MHGVLKEVKEGLRRSYSPAMVVLVETGLGRHFSNTTEGIQTVRVKGGLVREAAARRSCVATI